MEAREGLEPWMTVWQTVLLPFRHRALEPYEACGRSRRNPARDAISEKSPGAKSLKTCPPRAIKNPPWTSERPFMRERAAVLLLVSLGLASTVAVGARHPNRSSEGAATNAVTRGTDEHVRRQMLGHRSPTFEINDGQTDERVKFISRSSRSTLFLTNDEVVFTFDTPPHKTRTGTVTTSAPRAGAGAAAVRMRFAGSRPASAIEGLDPLPGKTHYFIGKDPRRWRTGVTTYARVVYKEIYPGVDVVYRSNDGQLEYDFVVAPNGAATKIRLSFDGADRVRVDPDGNLVVSAAGREIRQPRPYAYQDIDGVRREIASRYEIVGKTDARITTGEYNRHRILTVDPVLFYSTYLGGSDREGFDDEVIAVDRAGNVYITGSTVSTDFPAVGGLNSSYSGNSDAFVTKYDSRGALVYSSYLGGSGADEGIAVAVDVFGEAYVAGATQSSDFPITPGTIDTVCTVWPDGQCGGRGFVTKLDPTGTTLAYSTLLGGADAAGYPTVATSIALDNEFNAFVAGETGAGLPASPGAYQTTVNGRFDAFVAKLNSAGTSLAFVSYLGGTFDEGDVRLAVDQFGSMYVTGTTYSSDFPTSPGAFQRSCPTVEMVGGCFIAFVAKFNATADGLVYSTYLGGPAITGNVGLRGLSSTGKGIAVDSAGYAYVTGTTYATDFPTTAGSLRETSPGALDAFVTKMNTNGAGLVYSTYLGGRSEDQAHGIAVDSVGNAYVTGQTFSPDFPTVSPVQPGLAGNMVSDAFVAKLNARGDTLLYSTFLGGSGPGPWPGNETGIGIAVDAAGTAYVSGWTASTDFPVTNAAQPTFGGGLTDAFVAKIGERTCGTDVSEQVIVLRSPTFPFFVPQLQVQFVFVYNKSNAPIQGPLVLVEDALQNATALNFGPATSCFAAPDSPVVFLDAGPDNALAPAEAVFTGLLFYQSQPSPLSYTPHVVSGIPTQ